MALTDNRVIEMQFENRKFEKNIAKSQKSVEDLKKAMNFDETSKGMSKFAEGLASLDFSRLEDNIQKLTDKFTGLGTISELVVSQLRHRIEQAAAQISGFVDSMTTQQMSAGLEKFDMLNNSVQTIKAATGKTEEEVLGVMERLNQYTDQTSYNFADMAQNIGKFTSVGIDLDAAERQMEGIANWAARSGAGINEASRAMYNLSQAMGVGKLTLIDWKSIENAGMATKEFKQQMIDAAVAAGTLERTVNKKTGEAVYKTAKSLGKQVEVSAQNMGSTLNKGWATSGVLSATLEKYYWEPLADYDAAKPILELNEEQKKAFDAMFETDDKMSSTEWKTLESMGVMTDETKQKLLDLAVTNNKLTKEVDKDGKAIYKTIEKNGKGVEVTLENIGETLKTGWFDKELGKTASEINGLAKSSFEAAQKCLKFSDVLNAWKDQISTGWMNTWRIIFGDLTKSMEFFSAVCDKVADPLSKLIDLRNNILQSWSDQGGRKSLVAALIGDDENGVFGILDAFESVRELFHKGFLDFVGIFAGSGLRESFEDEEWGMRNLYAYIGAVLADLSAKVQNFVANIKTFFEEEIEAGGKTTTRLKMIQNVISGIAGAIAIGWTILRSALGFVRQVMAQLGPSLDSAMAFFSELGMTLYTVSGGVVQAGTIPKFFSDLAAALSPITGAINSVIGTFFDLLTTILHVDQATGTTSTLFGNIAATIIDLATKISKFATPILNFFRDIIAAIKGLFLGNFSTESLTAFGESVKTAFNTMLNGMPETVQKVINFLRNTWTTVRNVFTSGFSADSISKLKAHFSGAFKSLGDSIPQGLKTGFQNVLGQVKLFFTNLWANITGFVKKIFGGKPVTLKGVIDAIKKIPEFIPQGFKDGAKNVVSKVVTFFKSLWNKITAGVSKAFGSIPTTFTDIWTRITDLFAPKDSDKSGPGAFEKIKNWLSEKFTGLSSFVSSVGSTLKKIVAAIRKLFAPTDETKETFAQWLSKLDWGSILLILGSATGITLVILGVVKIIALIKSFFETMQDLLKVLKNGVKLKINNEAEKTKTFAEKALILAAAIGIIAASLIAVGNMPVDNALQGVAAIIVIMAGLVIVSKILKKTFEDMDIQNAASMLLGMIAISLAIASVSKSMISLGKLNPTQFEQAIWGLVAVVGAILVLGDVLQSTPVKFEDTSGLLAIAGAVWILVHAILPLKDIVDPNQWVRMIGGLTLIMAELLVFALLTNKLDAGMAGKGMEQMAALAVAIAILVAALVVLAFIPFTLLGKALIALGVILGELIIFMALTKKLSMAGSDLTQLIGLAVAVAILALSLVPLALLPLGRLAQGVGALGVILLELIGFMALTKKLSMAGSGLAQLIALAGAVAILGLALIPLALLDFGRLMGAVLAMVLIVAALGGFMVLVKKFGGEGNMNGIWGLVALSMAIVVLMVALMPLAALNPDQYAKVILGVIVIVGMLGLLVFATSKVDWKSALTSVVLMLSIMGVILVIGEVLKNVKDIPTDKLWAFFGGISILFGSLGVLALLAKVAGIYGILLAIGLVAGMIAAILGVVALIGPSAAGAVADMGAYLALFSGVIETFSKNMGNVDEGNVNKAGTIIDLLVDILKRAATFSGATDTAQKLTDAVASLTIFADLAGIFSKRMEKVTTTSIINAGAFVTGMKETFALIDGFTYTDNLNAFTTAVWDLGTTAESFATHTSGIGDVSQNGAIQLIKELSSCASDLETIEKLNIDTLTAQITGLGGAMMIYARGASDATGIETGEGAPDVAGAVRILSDISTALAENGGFTIPSNMPDEEALGTFGAQLAALAGALVMFEEAGAGLSTGTENAKAALTYFKNLKEDLVGIDAESLQSAMDIFGTGEGAITPGSLETFGKNIEQLGSALKSFAESTTNLDEATGEMKPVDYTKATEALTSLSKLTENLPTITSITPWVTVQKESLTQFSTDITELGSSLKTFAEEVQGTNDDTYTGIDKALPVGEDGKPTITILDKAIDVIGVLVEKHGELAKQEGKGGFIKTLWEGDPPDFKSLSKELILLGQGLSQFGKDISEAGGDGKPFDAEEVKAAVGVIDVMIPIMTDLSTKLPKVGGLTNIASTFATGRGAELKDVAAQIGEMGEGLAKFSSSISGKMANAEDTKNALNAIDSVITLMANVAQLEQVSFYFGNATEMAQEMNGFLKAIMETEKEDTTNALDTLVEMMEKISISISTADSINPDSLAIFSSFTNALVNLAGVKMNEITKNFETVGQNIAIGTQNGINTGSSEVINAAVQMALNAYNSARTVLGIRSPSRVFAGMGEFVAMGMANGIMDSTRLVEKSSTALGETAIDSAGNVLGMISRIMAEDANAHPTITPVLDMSQVNADMQAFGNGTYSGTIGLNTSGIAGRAGRIGQAYESVPDQNGIGLDSVLAQMSELGAQIQEMGASIRKMKIVLDSGVVAGGVTDDVDSNIGRKIFYANRNN